MDEAEAAADDAVPQARAGAMLRSAREAAGLSLAEVGARTRVPQRHLAAIEAGEYAELPSTTYAIGFARAYARAVKADEVAVAAQVRAELAVSGPRQSEYVPYELPDPARVPSRGLTVVSTGAALAVMILLGLWYGTNLFRSGSEPVPEPTATVSVGPPAAVPAPKPTVPTGGQVRLAATDEVWLRVYDADNKTLFLGTMKPGDHFDVPADAKGPKINVGRPDKLTVTLNGAPVPPLGTGERPIKNVPVDGASIAGRLAGAAAPTPGPSASPSPTPSASPMAVSTPTRAPAAATRRPAERPRRRLDEVQRANLQSLRTPAPAPSATP